MKLLLDTHIWLWTLREPHRVGKRTLLELKKDTNELWLSPISTWEALTLNFKGRIQIPGDLATWLAHATAGTKKLHSRMRLLYWRANCLCTGTQPTAFLPRRQKTWI